MESIVLNLGSQPLSPMNPQDIEIYVLMNFDFYFSMPLSMYWKYVQEGDYRKVFFSTTKNEILSFPFCLLVFDISHFI